jgi:hypothetical protein
MLRRMMLGKMREQAARRGRQITASMGKSRGRDGLTVFGVHDAKDVGVRLLVLAEDLALAKAALAPVSPLRAARSPRAFSDRHAPDVSEPDWGSVDIEPDENDEFALEAEAEAAWERQQELEMEIDAAVDAELARLRQIDLVRMANGQPPKARSGLVRIVLPRPPGRGA